MNDELFPKTCPICANELVLETISDSAQVYFCHHKPHYDMIFEPSSTYLYEMMRYVDDGFVVQRVFVQGKLKETFLYIGLRQIDLTDSDFVFDPKQEQELINKIKTIKTFL